MPPKKKVEPEAATSAPTEVKAKKPRAKRTATEASHVVAVVSSTGIQGSLSQAEISRKPLIVHLPIHSSTVRFYEDPLTYDPTPPKDTEAFNAIDTNPFTEEGDVFDNTELVKQIVSSYEKEEPVQAPVVQKKEPVSTAATPSSSKEYGPTKLLIEYANTKNTHELPPSTESACFWCCEQFSNRPCVLPISIINGVWQVYGNYCNPNCALAALLAETIDTHVRWERIALLHMLYGEDYKTGRIYPAPDRTVLQRFGGPMAPVDFRNLCERGRLRIDIHMPPLVSILASMDTKPIDFYESTINSSSSMITTSASTESGSAAGLKLKRSKPLKEREHTLDNILGFNMAKRTSAE
jgi:hypothetical protein